MSRRAPTRTLGPSLRDVDEAVERGLADERAGRVRQAHRLYETALAADPSNARALRGVVRLSRHGGFTGAAIRLLRRAVSVAPERVDCVADLGDVCSWAGRVSEAVACYRQASALSPGDAELLTRLGYALLSTGRVFESLHAHGRAVRIRPDRASGHLDLGTAQCLAGHLDEAVASFRTAIALEPDWADAHNNLGHALKEQGRLDDAVEAFRRAVALAPGETQIHSNLLYTLWYHPSWPPEAVFEEHRRWAERHERERVPGLPMHRNDRTPDRRLRVGYVSPDFREHPLGLLIEPVLAAHDRRAVEVVCYSDATRPDARTARIRDHADVWRQTAGLSDARVEHQIRVDRIDVLVDLTLHMAGSRLPLFARRPAPVQVTYLAYPATSGLRAMDYRITDARLDPPEETDAHHTERLVRLTGSYWRYAPQPDDPPVNPLPAGETGHVTFGSLNNFCKLNPAVLELWARILDAMPGSQLAVLVNGRSATAPAALADRGIAPERARLLTRAPRGDYLRYYHAVDIGLDPFPCGGHTTTLDALWMGVPVVTLVGRTAMGRAAASQLAALGLGELVADSPEEYVAIAVALARDRGRLRDLRATMRERMRAAALLDVTGLARELEAAYRQMWIAWCARPT